jgi:hypothetical protein
MGFRPFRPLFSCLTQTGRSTPSIEFSVTIVTENTVRAQ